MNVSMARLAQNQSRPRPPVRVSAMRSSLTVLVVKKKLPLTPPGVVPRKLLMRYMDGVAAEG